MKLIFNNNKKKKKFEKIADEWLEFKKNTIKESTYYNYMFIIENYLKPQFKNLNFKSIINYNDFIQNLSMKLSSKTIRDIIVVLKAIFRYYEEEYNCQLKIKKSSIPKLEKKRLKILTKRETRMIEDYCLKKNTLKNIGIVICLNTGLRIGEICALRWEDIEIEEKKIYIRNTVKRIYNKKKGTTKVVIDVPKTQCSVREIPISKKLYQILKPLKYKYNDKDFLLSGTEKCIEPRYYQKTFNSILKELKIKHYKFHVLRHTFSTQCIEVGMDIKSLSEILGHSDINVTLKIYVHSSDNLKKKYLEKL